MIGYGWTPAMRTAMEPSGVRRCFPRRLCGVFKVQNTVDSQADRLILVDRLFVENPGKPHNSSRLVTVAKAGSGSSTWWAI